MDPEDYWPPPGEPSTCAWEDCEDPVVDAHVIEHVKLDYHVRIGLCAEHLILMQQPKEKPLRVTLTLGPDPSLRVHVD